MKITKTFALVTLLFLCSTVSAAKAETNKNKKTSNPVLCRVADRVVNILPKKTKKRKTTKKKPKKNSSPKLGEFSKKYPLFLIIKDTCN